MKRHLPHLVVFAVVAIVYLLEFLAPLEHMAMALRFKLAERAMSGDVVLVEIDAPSLETLSVWPWPRTYHAELLDKLIAAGARQVAFDIDLSSHSTREADRALGAAIARAGDRVVLPGFKQASTDAAGVKRLNHTLPLPEFSHTARVASATVRVESGSVARRFSLFEPWQGGGALPSLPAALSGTPDAADPFYLDFGLRLDTLPRLSYADVLTGAFDPRAVSGRTVIVGATAVELGDRVPVPVHGIVAGPEIHAIAFESLHQGRAIFRIAPWLVLLAAALGALTLAPALCRWRWRTGLAAVTSWCAGSFALSVGVQTVLPVSIDIAPLWLTVLGSYGWNLVRVIDTQAVSLLQGRAAWAQRHAMMKSVVDDSFDGIVIVNQDGNIQVFNAAAQRLTGHAASEVVGQPVHSFIPWSEPIENLYEDESDSADGTSAPSIVGPAAFEMRRADGDLVTIEMVVSVSRVFVGRGRRNATSAPPRRLFIYTFRDITERRGAEETQRRAVEQATAANRAKTEFLANMSHELRTPLNAMLGFAELMQSEIFGPLGSDRYKEYIGDIHGSGQHLLSVINDILDMSRIEAGEMRIIEEEVEVQEVLESCLRLIRDRAKKAGLRLLRDEAEQHAVLQADARMVKQMLLNLLGNAVKFTPENGVVRVSHRVTDRGDLLIQITDTGIGIPADRIEAVFEPFAQVDSTLSRKYEGTGLGLPLVRSMMALHGGTVYLDSEPGVGTTASLSFPNWRVALLSGADSRSVELFVA